MVSEKLEQEILRKTIHIGCGLGLYYYANYAVDHYSAPFLSGSLLLFFCILIVIDFCRYNFSLVLPFQSRWMREHEEKALIGSTWFVMGVVLAVLFFDFDIAMTSILMLTFGDSLAALSGQIVSKPLFWGRPAINAITGIIVNSVIGTYFLSFWIGFPMAVAATLADLRSDIFDDNITIPVSSGVIGHLVRYLIG